MTQRYDTYKDSGVQWLGEIPGHWECVPLKRICEMKSGNNLTSLDILDAGDFPVYGANGFRGYYNQFNKEGKYILIGRQGALAGNVHLVDGKFWATDHAIVVTLTSNKVCVDYMSFALISMNLNQYAFDTAAQPGLAVSKIIPISAPLPPLSEQRSIVSFLDDKCGKIDEWVNKKQKEVEHLQELKQRVIADAVTRGLNPNVKMKATNIPWLKEIPEHWECVKLKMFCQDNKEKNKGNIESCVLSLSYGNIIVKKNVNFGLVPENYESYQIVNPGNIILRLTDLQNDHKSLRTGLVKNRGIITSAYVGLIVKNMNSEYTQLILHSYDVMKVFYGMGGGLRQSMSYTDIANVYIPVPPLSEQRSIVSYLDAKCSKIDKLIANITKEIECIKEYKQRLISDVVTGQIKVC